MGHLIKNLFICKECVFVFTIHSQRSKKRVLFCPNCGESIATEKYKPIKKSPKKPWTEDEMVYVDRIIKGEIFIYQAAVALGRTKKSVSRRVDRRKEELQQC
jgi:hypothetical protein